jgi:hypothetical protein
MEINTLTNQLNLPDVLSWPTTRPNKIDSSSRQAAEKVGNLEEFNAPKAQTLSISAHIDYIKSQLDALIKDYPPFFPVGSPQRADLIKSIKGIQEKIENAPVLPELKKNLGGSKLNDQATDNDIAAATDSLTAFMDLALKKASVIGKEESGKVVNLKI